MRAENVKWSPKLAITHTTRCASSRSSLVVRSFAVRQFISGVLAHSSLAPPKVGLLILKSSAELAPRQTPAPGRHSPFGCRQLSLGSGINSKLSFTASYIFGTPADS